MEPVQALNHASAKITNGVVIYIDPYHLEPEQETADIILITHSHHDHFSQEDIDNLSDENTILVTPENMPDISFSGEHRTVTPGDTCEISGITVEAVPAYNTDKEFHPKGKNWAGYIVTVDGTRIYHTGDTDRIPEMKDITADIALLPVSGTYVMTAMEAARAFEDIGAEEGIPIHFGEVVGSKADAEKFYELIKEQQNR